MTARRKPKNRRIMREFMIKELSAVDRPAQGGALAVLMKRDDEDDKDDDYKTAKTRRRVKDSLSEFLEAVEDEDDELAEAAKKSISAVPALADLLHSKGDTEMSDAEKKQIDDLQKKVDELNKALEAATAEEPAKKNAALQGEVETLKAQMKELTSKAEAADKAKADAEALAKLSDDEKAHLDSLEKADREGFLAMSAEERTKLMRKSDDDNPVVYKSEASGEEYRKNDDPRLVKLAKQADENDRLAKAEREKREAAEFAKRAEEAPYDGFAIEKAKDGEDEVTKADVVRAISKMDDGPRKVLEKWLGVGSKAISAAFGSIGHSHEQAQKSANDFEKRINEIMKRDEIDRLKAMSKAQAEYPEEFKAFQDSGVAAN